MSTELLQPGVSVIQEFRSVSPTIVTPTLVPCAVAPAFQILEALTTDATGNQNVNTDAIASLAAIQQAANPAPYAGLDGLTLEVSINDGATQTFTFADPTSANLNASQVADQINGASTAPVGFAAFVVTKGVSSYVELRSNAVGDGQTLKVLGGTANSVLGFNEGFVAEGLSTYKQDKITVAQANFPDPRGIIDELDIAEDTIRVFVDQGGTLKEFKRNQSFLRKHKEAVFSSTTITFPMTGATGTKFSFKRGINGAVEEYTFSTDPANMAALLVELNTTLAIPGTIFSANPLVPATILDATVSEGRFEVLTPSASAGTSFLGWVVGNKAFTVEPVDDGDGDTVTPFVVADSDNFTNPATSAQLVGTVALSGAVNGVHTKTFQIAKDGCTQQEITLDGGPITGAAVFDSATNTLDTETFGLIVNGTTHVVTFTGANPLAIATVIAQINAQVGATVAYETGALGVPGTGYISFQVGGATPVPGGTVVLDYVTAGAGNDNTWTDLGLAAAIGANVEQTLTIAEIITQINNTMGSGFASNDGSDQLQLDSVKVGSESNVTVGKGTANAVLGFTDSQRNTGGGHPPVVGDALWAGGAFLGNITVVAPGGINNRLKLDREVSITGGWSAHYIQAMGIPTPVPSTRPTPDLVIDTSGAALTKHDFLRNTDGEPIVAQGSLIIAYNALRLDVTPQANDPALLTFSDTATLEETLAPLNTDNPLGLMLFFSLINATGISVAGIGVDGVDSANPDGTPLAFSKALTFLEAQEVYALAPSSQDPIVHQLFMTHVNAMSDPDAKGERVVLINPEMPREGLPALVSSGTNGDSGGVTNTFDTKLASLSSDVLSAGLDPSGTIPVSDGLYLDISADNKRYSIAAISGTNITIRVVFAPGENDDGYYSVSNLPGTLISETFSINVRGAELTTPTGDLDYKRIADTYQALGQSYGNRRVIMVAPERVGASIDGVEQLIKGYYLCSAISGMTGQLAPSQGFTNFPITGFTRVKGSNDVFSKSQLQVGSAGGTWWVVQEVAGAPLTTFHQLTTDLSSIETREYSITKVVDFTAKFMRSGLRNFIGKFNITQPFLDTLSTVVQGQLSFLTESGVIIGGDLNNIVQDEDAPDTVLIDVTLDVPYPANYIRLTLVI